MIYYWLCEWETIVLLRQRQHFHEEHFFLLQPGCHEVKVTMKERLLFKLPNYYSTEIINYFSQVTYPTGPAAKISLSRSKPLIRTYTPLPSPPMTLAAEITNRKKCENTNHWYIKAVKDLNWHRAVRLQT